MSEVAWFTAGAVVAAAVAWSIGRYRAGNDDHDRIALVDETRRDVGRAKDTPAADAGYVDDDTAGHDTAGSDTAGNDAAGSDTTSNGPASKPGPSTVAPLGALPADALPTPTIGDPLTGTPIPGAPVTAASTIVESVTAVPTPGTPAVEIAGTSLSPTDRTPDAERDHPAVAGDTDDWPVASDVDGRRVARSVAREIADLASAVEGSAFDLVGAAPEPERVPRAAQRFLGAVQRLRALHAKLVSFGTDAAPSGGSTDFHQVVSGLTEELQHLRLGLELDTEIPSDLPAVACDTEVVRNILLFACSAMFRAEPGATNLTIAAERSLVENEPRLRVEMLLEWVVDSRDGEHPAPHESDVALAIEAARRLVEGHGGKIRMDRLPDRVIRTRVRLPASMRPAEPEPGADRDGRRRHQAELSLAVRRHEFGGTLVVEADPDVRAMLARELRASGRAVFACADGTSARTFLEATPQRFELLIVDQEHRLEDRDALGETIRRLTPDLKICVLASASPASAASPKTPAWPEVCRLQKPFGVHELRRALASVLDA